MPEETILRLTRDNIEARWTVIRDSRLDEVVTEFLATLRECDPDLQKVNRIEITLDDEGSHSVAFRKARAPRWDEDTYAENIGSYEKEYNSVKHADASGTYRLDIRAGRSEAEKVYMELTEPSGRVFAFPPENENTLVGREGGKPNGNPVAGAQRVECPSISRLLRDSSHKTTLSVWQYFNLKRSDEGEGDEGSEG
jgi:hypothetical protein